VIPVPYHNTSSKVNVNQRIKPGTEMPTEGTKSIFRCESLVQYFAHLKRHQIAKMPWATVYIY
jgi:hypothetical protein